MDSLQTILALIFLVGIIGLLWTTFTYPKDVSRGFFVELPKLVFSSLPFQIIKWIIQIPIWLVLLVVDFINKTDRADRILSKIPFAEKSKEKLFIDIHSFQRLVIIEGLPFEEIEKEIKEAADTNSKLDISEYNLRRVGHVIVLHLPNVGLHAFGLIVQWLEDKTAGTVHGLAQSPSLKFAFYQPKDSMNLHGITTDGKKFYIDLREDVDQLGALRLDQDLEMDVKFNFDHLPT